MPLISHVGLRSPATRCLMGAVYLALGLGAVTMVYPFALMLANSFTSNADYQEFKLLPRYFHNDKALFKKYVVDKCPMEYLRYQYGQDWYAPQDIRVEQRVKGRDGRPGVVLDSLKGLFAIPQSRLGLAVADYLEFLGTCPELYRFAYFCHTGKNDYSVLDLKPKYWAWLEAKYQTVAAVNAAYTENAQAFDELGVPYEDPPPPTLAAAPGRPPRRLAGVQTHLAAPPDLRGQRRARLPAVPPRVLPRPRGAAPAHQAAPGRPLRPDLRPRLPGQAPPARAAGAVPPQTLPGDLPQARPGAGRGLPPVRRRQVPQLLGGAQGRAPGRALLHHLPHGHGLLRPRQRLDRVHGVRPPPLDKISFVDPQLMYQALLRSKYKTVEAVNAAYGWDKRGFADVALPAPLVDLHAFRVERKALLWRYATGNYAMVLGMIAVHGRALFNTVVFVLLSILSSLTVSPLAAYALSRYRLKHTNAILLFLLATMAFPAAVGMIPSFLLLKDLGLLNTFAALVLPGLAQGYGIFLLKGFFDSLPAEIFEAAHHRRRLRAHHLPAHGAAADQAHPGHRGAGGVRLGLRGLHVRVPHLPGPQDVDDHGLPLRVPPDVPQLPGHGLAGGLRRPDLDRLPLLPEHHPPRHRRAVVQMKGLPSC